MSYFTIKMLCPHCRHDATLQVTGIRMLPDPAECGDAYGVTAFCGYEACRGPIAMKLFSEHEYVQAASTGVRPSLPQSLTNVIEIAEVWPPQPTPDVPAFMHPSINGAFLEAEETRIGGQKRLSAIGYRTVIDLATKQISPPADATKIEMLGARLGRLSREGHLTPSIGEWAEHIGFLGNAATHDCDELSNSELDELANLTKATLIYLISLPEAVKRLRGQPTDVDEQLDPATLAQRLTRWMSFKPRLGRK